MNRWPTLLLLAALLAGLIAVERSSGDDATADETASGEPGTVATLDLAAARSTTGGSTWYCAGGFTTPDATNDHRIVITNPADTAARGTLTLYPSLVDTLGNPVSFDRAVQTVDVGAGETVSVSLAPVVASLNPLLSTETGSFVGALVEFDTPGVAVEHSLLTPLGRARTRCATSASTSWWFPSGTTVTGVDHQIYLLNPFPDDAVVDITFVTDGGVREPTAFDGRLVPAQSLTMLDIGPIVQVWPQVAAEITTRTGRVVAERVQIFGGADGPNGVTLAPGIPYLSEQWFFPAGRGRSGAGESYVVHNPSSTPAEVEFELKPDSADLAGDLAPIPFVIGPNERWVVDVHRHARHPSESIASIDATGLVLPGEGYFVSVRSFNGVPIAVERVLTVGAEQGSGASQSPGIPLASTDQLLSLPAAANEGTVADGEDSSTASAVLAVLNPAGDTIARVEVWSGGDDEPSLRRQVELAPRRRAAFDLATIVRPGDRWVRISSSVGTMAEIVEADDESLTATAAVPAAESISIPDLYAFD